MINIQITFLSITISVSVSVCIYTYRSTKIINIQTVCANMRIGYVLVSMISFTIEIV